MAINWDPTGAEEVEQNVRTLLKTAPGSVPLARAMGTPQDVVDSPISLAAARLTADVVAAVKTYEPRAKITKVVLDGDADGRLEATVTMEGVE